MKPAAHPVRRLLILLTGAASIVGGVTSLVFVFTAARQAGELLLQNGYERITNAGLDSPLVFFVRCFANEQCNNNFWSAWTFYYNITSLIVAGAGIVGLILVMTLWRAKDARTDPATGRWSTKQDLKRKGYLQDPNDLEQRGYVGMHPSGKMLRVPQKIRFSHALVLGGPGAKKSTGYHWQNILSDAEDGWSTVIFDLKYPDPQGGFVGAVPHFEKLGYDVKVFAPYDDVTHHLPIIRDAADEKVAREIAEMIVPPDPNAGNAEFYRNNERRVIAGLLMHAAEYNVGFHELHAILQSGASGLQKFVNGQNVFGQGKATNYGPANDKVRTICSALFEKDPNEQAGLVTGIEGKLQFFADERLGRATRLAKEPWKNIDLSSLGKNKSLLYVGIPQKYIDGGSGKLLLQLIKRMIDSALSDTAYQNGGKVPNPVSFYLDEFPSLGRLPNVESNFATMRSRQVAYHLTVQNISQGKAIYGDATFKSFFTSNFQTIMLYPAFIKFEDAEYISKILGSTMTSMKGEGQSKSDAGSSTSQNVREATRPLVTVDEMQTWPSDEAIVILNGVPHTRVVVPGIFEASCQGVKNPFFDTFKSLSTETLDTRSYVESLMEREKARHMREELAPLRHNLQVKLREKKRVEERERLAREASQRRKREKEAKRLEEKRREEREREAAAKKAERERERERMAAAAEDAPRVPPMVDRSRNTSTSPSSVSQSEESTPLPDEEVVDGRRIRPRKALNRLASHIIQAQADVKPKGDRRKPSLKELQVPVPLVVQHLYPDEIEFLTKQGVMRLAGKHYKIHEAGLKLLDEQWFNFFTKKLPNTTNKQRYNRKEVERGFKELADFLIDNEIGVKARVNGGTGEVERLEFSAWAIEHDLLAKYQVGWGAHGILEIKEGIAIVRRKGLATLSAKQLRALAGKEVNAPKRSEPTPTKAGSERKESANNKKRPDHPMREKGMKAPKPPKASISPRDEKGVKPQQGKQKQRSEGKNMVRNPKAKDPPKAPKEKPQASSAAPATSAGDRTPQATEKRATHEPVKVGLGEDFTVRWWTDTGRDLPVVRLHTDEQKSVIQTWAKDPEVRSRVLGLTRKAAKTTKPLGAFHPDRLYVALDQLSDLGFPPIAEGDLRPFQFRTIPGKTVKRTYMLKRSAIVQGKISAWIEDHGSRLVGHPSFTSDNKPLVGVEVQEEVMQIERTTAEELFERAFPDEVVKKVKLAGVKVPVVTFHLRITELAGVHQTHGHHNG